MEKNTPSRNANVLADFTKYCQDHPYERFWQALRNWSGEDFILVGTGNKSNVRDTFYRDGK